MPKKNKKEVASIRFKVFPSTHRRLKVRAAKEGKTLAKLADELSLKK